MNVLEKREYLYGKKQSKETLKSIADKFLEGNYINDAMDCFILAEDKEGLEKIKKIAAEKGDFFLLDKISKGLELKNEDWEEIGIKANELGKFHFALKAFERAGNEKKADEIKSKFEKEKFISLQS